MSFPCYLAILATMISLLFSPQTTSAVGPESTGRPESYGKNETLRLSLAQTVAMALKNNLPLQTARRKINTAASDYRTAKAGYYPKIEADLTGNQTFSNLIRDRQLVYDQVFTAGLNITAAMPLDLSGAVGRAVQQALISFITEKANYAIS
ncbi:MAG: TolC family protein, partial [Desulfobaccales bacterium]